VMDRTNDLLVCVYYRVAAGDSARVIADVREFQRTLRGSSGAADAQVLLRCDLPPRIPPAPLPDDRPASRHSSEPPAGVDLPVDPAADATVMETYRLALPAAGGADADAAVRHFLATLESAALPLAGLLRGARHVELFAPCA
jgi:hypothetical protein